MLRALDMSTQEILNEFYDEDIYALEKDAIKLTLILKD